MENNKIALFQEKEIRRVWHNEEWWFAINDVIQALTNTPNPLDYFRKMLKRDVNLHQTLSEGEGQIVLPLSIQTAGGKQKVKCANTEGLLRIIMSIPSPKAEPFKLWLAQVGKERIEEIENPEIGFERLRNIYKAKGYPEDWIQTRLQTIEIRKLLTDEWKNRGVKEGKEYSILTAQIAKATFGLTPTEHKAVKQLDKENLRDHMVPLELIFTALGEETTRQIAIRDDAQGFPENAEAAQKGGQTAGNLRKKYEEETNIKVVSPQNYLNLLTDKDKTKEDNKE